MVPLTKPGREAKPAKYQMCMFGNILCCPELEERRREESLIPKTRNRAESQPSMGLLWTCKLKYQGAIWVEHDRNASVSLLLFSSLLQMTPQTKISLT